MAVSQTWPTARFTPPCLLSPENAEFEGHWRGKQSNLEGKEENECENEREKNNVEEEDKRRRKVVVIKSEAETPPS